MYVYKITNTVTDKVYVGQTTYKNPRNRWSAHKCDLKRNRCNNQYLQRAWNKHGEEAFQFDVVAEATTQKQLDKLEVQLIAELQTRNPLYGYNLRSGGARGKHTEETKRKLSASRNKLYASAKGRKLKQHLSALAKKQNHPLAENIQRSKTQRKYEWDSPILVSPEGKRYTVHTVKGFCREHGIKHDGHIRHLIRGNRKQYKGWTLA